MVETFFSLDVAPFSLRVDLQGYFTVFLVYCIVRLVFISFPVRVPATSDMENWAQLVACKKAWVEWFPDLLASLCIEMVSLVCRVVEVRICYAGTNDEVGKRNLGDANVLNKMLQEEVKGGRRPDTCFTFIILKPLILARAVPPAITHNSTQQQ